MLDVFLRKYPFSSDYFLFDDPEDEEEDDKKDPPKGGGGSDDEKPKDAAYWEAEAKKWQQLSRKNEKAANEGKTAQQRLKELEDAGKSEAQKLQERIAELETSHSSSTLELARVRVALRKGLTEAQAKRLVGKDEDELEKDADELIKDLGIKKDEGNNSQRRTPRENLRNGSSPNGGSEPDEMDPRKLAAQVRR